MGEIFTAGNGKCCLSPGEKCGYFLEPIRGDISIVEVSGKYGIVSPAPQDVSEMLSDKKPSWSLLFARAERRILQFPDRRA